MKEDTELTQIEKELKKLDASIEFTDAIRVGLIGKLNSEVMSIPSIKDLNGAGIAGVASLVSGLGTLIHQHETTKFNRVKMEVSQGVSKDLSSVAEIATAMLRKMNGKDFQFNSSLPNDNKDDAELDARLADLDFALSPDEISEVETVLPNIETEE
jgi:hypothetical protein